MPRRLVSLYLTFVLTAALVAGAGIVAFGYIGQQNVKVIISGPSGSVRCDRAATVSVKVVSAQNNKPINKQVVRWGVKGAGGVSARRTVTNKQGRTSVNVTFGGVAGARTVTASASNASSKVRVRCAGGLPKTSIVPPEGYLEQPASALLPTVIDQPTSVAVPVERIRLDRLGIDLPVVEGDGVTVPEGFASHFPDTAWPGEGSNTYLYAHAREDNFLELWQVRTGDLIDVDLVDGGVAAYRVSEIHPVVAWDALEYTAATASERLTLQTSLSYEDTAPRFIVIAERVGAE